MKHALVVTSISEPTPILKAQAAGALEHGWPFYVIGDKKSRVESFADFYGGDFFSVNDQVRTGFQTPAATPLNNYSRKNVGYLLAMWAGADVIVETDDDNRPYAEFWEERRMCRSEFRVTGHGEWRNPLSYLESDSMEPIWPRGYPLDIASELLTDDQISDEQFPVVTPIQQGLIDGDPDIDAVRRLIGPPAHDKTHGWGFLEERFALFNSWCPFNSQNTTWFKQAFPLMYLPSFCKDAYRMDDIWRSFIAQRIAFENGWAILWGGVTVVQQRNPHNLMKDFEQEIPGYLYNRNIVEMLKATPIVPGTDPKTLLSNMYLCYLKMIQAGWIEKREAECFYAWRDDVLALNAKVPIE